MPINNAPMAIGTCTPSGPDSFPTRSPSTSNNAPGRLRARTVRLLVRLSNPLVSRPGSKAGGGDRHSGAGLVTSRQCVLLPHHHVIRHETASAARWALLLIVRTLFDHTITVAVRTGFSFHVCLPADIFASLTRQ